MSPLQSTPAIFRVRAILFDMDGVLISSTAADERGWLRWARLHGMLDTFDLASTHGRRAIDTICALRPDLDAVEEQARLEAIDAEDMQGITILPGVHRLLAGLLPHQWCIVTSASDRLMQRRLSAAGIALPPQRVTADHVSQGKPHPEPYRLGARLLGLAPSACLVIEDAPSGIAAANAADCPVLAVAFSHAPEQLTAATAIAPSLEAVHLHQQPDGSIEVVCTCFPP